MTFCNCTFSRYQFCSKIVTKLMVNLKLLRGCFRFVHLRYRTPGDIDELRGCILSGLIGRVLSNRKFVKLFVIK